MDFFKTLSIATSGLKAQAGRMRIIAENIANADSLPRTQGEQPYRRKIATFHNSFDRELDANVLEIDRVKRDSSPYERRYEPGHPAADATGYVNAPNINSLVETMDLREAQRSYEANLNVVSATRRMLQRTLDILRA
jgi:flagellar basal-body rod protein FlgC